MDRNHTLVINYPNPYVFNYIDKLWSVDEIEFRYINSNCCLYLFNFL